MKLFPLHIFNWKVWYMRVPNVQGSQMNAVPHLSMKSNTVSEYSPGKEGGGVNGATSWGKCVGEFVYFVKLPNESI